MKKLVLTILLIGSFSISNAQFLNFGIKGGINGNENGKMRIDFEEFEEKLKSHQEPGYHFGVFSEIKIPIFYIRPELVYTHTESSYKLKGDSPDISNSEADLSINKIDIPILVGIKILGLGRIFAGPSFQYIISSDLDVDDLKEINSDDFGTNVQIGVGLELGRIGADIRWEQGLSDLEAEYKSKIDSSNKVRVDTSPQQVIFSVYYKFK